MKKFQFDNFNNTYLVSLQVFSVSCMIIGGFELVEFKNPDLYVLLQSVGFLTQFFVFSRSFWFQHYIQWNKRGMMIRSKSFGLQSFRFRDIENVELDQDVLTITKKDGGCYDFDVQGVRPTDSKKLVRLIRQKLG